jgi:hypothetical protein
MNRKKQRSEGLRTNLLHRAEVAVTKTHHTSLLARCLVAWREPTWRSRRSMQRSLNVLTYRIAMAQARRGILAAAFGVWAEALRVEVLELQRILATPPLDPSARPPETPAFTPPPGLTLWRPQPVYSG